MSATATRPTRPTPPWLFLFLEFPYASAVGYASIAMPYWIGRSGVGLDELAGLAAMVTLPHGMKILWIPVLDLAGRKRAWSVGMSFATAALLAAASLVPDPAAHLRLYGLLVAASQATATTAHAANNALMAITTRPGDKGKAGGFSMASNVGGTGLFGALAVMVGEVWSPREGGFAVAAVALAMGMLALRIDEPIPVRPAATAAPGFLSRSRAGQVAFGLLVQVRELLRDIWRTLRSREGFTGLVICLAPVGCQAMSNLFSGIAVQYGAGARLVSLANGVGGGVAGAAGAILGGVLADWMSRRYAYAASGTLTALCALAMAAAPMTPATYAWGTFAYLFAGGLAFATWAGMVLEMVGLSAATATKYAIFNASLNLAISFMIRLDGRGGQVLHERLGLASARGALVTDAVFTFLGVGVLLAVVLVAGRRARPVEAARGAGA